MEKKATQKQVSHHYKTLKDMQKEISKIIIGQNDVVKGLLRGLLCNGHVFVEGVPGIAKTLLIRTLAEVSGCKFSRIQFTVDLLPTDITGITSYNEKKGFYTIKGPIFANFVIADEINRAPPKTQSALLEAMQEQQVTIAKKTFKLESPFFVMATQNPIETSGTYPLPEAQLDRFLFKVLIRYPKKEEEEEIMNTNITLRKFGDFKIKPVINKHRILQMQEFTKTIFLKEDIKKYITDIVDATRNPKTYKVNLGKYIEWGASPRASIGLFIAAKAEALLNNSHFVTPSHIKNVAHDVIRHRIIMNYEAQAESITADDIIDEILSKVPVP